MYSILPNIAASLRLRKATRAVNLELLEATLAAPESYKRRFTVPAMKVDLNRGSQADPVTGYVAMSTFKQNDDVLIIQVHRVWNI